MKKTLIALVALSGLAMADYTWVGGDVTAADSAAAWKNPDNWSGVEIGTTNGPLTSGSNLWGAAVIGNGADIVLGDGVTLDGWEFSVTVTGGSSLTINRMTKIQNPGLITVGEDSALIISQLAQGSNGYKGGTPTFQVDGTLDVNFSGGGNAVDTTITLGDNASVTLRNLSSGSRTLTLNTDLSSSSSSGISLLSRTLLTLDNVSFGNIVYNMGDGWVQSATPLAATAENVGKFYVSFEDGGKTLKAYYVAPEPATATLSLLALAGLAARRRRH